VTRLTSPVNWRSSLGADAFVPSFEFGHEDPQDASDVVRELEELDEATTHTPKRT
jgi:hypothetical protein